MGTQFTSETINQTRRRIRFGTTTLIGLTILSIAIAVFAVRSYSISQKTLDLLYAQSEIWHQIANVVTFNISNESTSEFKSIFEKRRIDRLKQLTSLLAENRAEVDAVLSAAERYRLTFGVSEDKLRQTYDSVHLYQIGKSLDEYLTLTSHTDVILLSALYADNAVVFRSGDYLAPLEQAIAIARTRADNGLLLTNAIIIAIGFSLAFTVFLIKSRVISPALTVLEQKLNEERDYQRRIEKHQALISNAFFAMDEAVIVVDHQGNTVANNDPYLQLVGKRVDNQNAFQTLTDAVFSKNRPAGQSALIPDPELVAQRLEQDPDTAIGDQTVTWSCARVATSYWIFVGRDTTYAAIEAAALRHKERLEALGEMASGIAHDFNNILGGIVMRSELALATNEFGAQTRPVFNGFIESSMRAKALISQLLSYSRRQSLEPRAIDVDEIVARVKRQLIVPEHIEFQLVNNATGKVFVDIEFMITAIENIVQNSIYAIGDESGTIKLLFDNDSETASISILDTGGGFSDEALRRADEPFFTTKPANFGSGLGLAMVAGFVAQSRGQFRLANRKNGAIVTMSFPLTAVNPAEVAKVITMTKHTGKQPNQKDDTIIVVEDNKTLAELQSRFLQRYSSNVLSFENNCSTIAFLDSGTPIKFALFDWCLGDGISEATIRKCIQKYPSATIVIASGNVTAELQAFATFHDIDVLEKPFNLRELAAIVEETTRIEIQQNVD